MICDANYLAGTCSPAPALAKDIGCRSLDIGFKSGYVISNARSLHAKTAKLVADLIFRLLREIEDIVKQTLRFVNWLFLAILTLINVIYNYKQSENRRRDD